MTKTPNQIYKESGSSLPFSAWIQREKDKGVAFANKLLEDVVEDAKKTETQDTQKKFDFGIPKWVIFTGVAIISGALIYKVYKTKK